MKDKTHSTLGRTLNKLFFGTIIGMAFTGGLAAVPAAATDASPATLADCGTSGVKFLGFSDALNKTSFGGFSVSELSGLTYDQNRDVYYAVADRAGTVQSHYFTLSILIEDVTLGTPSIQAVTVLKDASGTPTNGLVLDGEGIVVTAHDQLFVASEGGSSAGQQPEVTAFELDGTHVDDLLVPTRFLIGTNNLSFESMGISPTGLSLFTATEAPLSVDGQTADLRSRIRVLRYGRQGIDQYMPEAQFQYETEPGRNATELGLADVIGLSDRELLVLERGFVAGTGNTIRIFHTSTQHAIDVSDVPSLASTGFTPMTKQVLVDLVSCPSSGAALPPGATQPNTLLDNFEAMTLGPKLGHGYQALILLSDDNSAANQTTRVVVLAVPESRLAGSEPD